MVVSRSLVILVLAFSFLTVSMITVSAEEPNVGILRVVRFIHPREVAPNSTFQVTVGVEYALHGRPDNATIRAAIYGGVVDFSNPLWQSNPELVARGGDKLWNASLVSPAAEGELKLTAYAFYLDEGRWNFFNNTMNGPSFSQARIKIGKLASIGVSLGAPSVPVTFDDAVVATSIGGEARMTLLVGRTHLVSVPSLVEFQNSTRLVFEGWNDGRNQTQRTVMLDGDEALVGRYKVQYLLKVDYLSSFVSEWHDAGSTVTLRPSSDSKTNWLINVLGVREGFAGWTGDVSSSMPEIQITMDRPLTVTVVRSLEYGSLIVPCIFGVGLIGAVTLLLLRRKRIGRVDEELAYAEEVNLQCPSCGQPVEVGWVHCVKCGADLPEHKPTKF
jgi:hypothetical protein